MRSGMNRKKSVLITYTSYWIESRYTNVAEALHKEAIKPNTSLSVFEIDSYHACSNAATMHFAHTLTVLTFNLVSGGDFRRKPEIKTSPSPISTIHLFGVCGIKLEIFFYTWSRNPTDYSGTEIHFHLTTADHLRNAEVTTGQSRLSDWVILITW